MTGRARVEVEAVCKSFEGAGQNSGTRLHVLQQVSFTVADGEIVSLFGPNGCGKTTLLNIVAGLVSADSGEVRIQSQDRPRATVGYVFQNYTESLLPWRSALDNVALPLELRGLDRRNRREQAADLLRRLDISVEQAAYPYQMSGGQQQLVAIARALMADPDVLALDEPFGSLDFRTRIMMEQKLQEIHARTQRATIFVSHDIDEALLLADRFILLGSPPTRVIDTMTVTAPRPRLAEWVTSHEFVEMKARVLEKFMQVSAS
jgi:NitT/TauT family transport system ATP-binding protein